MKKSVIMTIVVLCILLAGVIGIGALNREPERKASVNKEEQRDPVKAEKEPEMEEVADAPKEEPADESEAQAVEEIQEVKEEKSQKPEDETIKEEEVTEPEEKEETKEEISAEETGDKKNETTPSGTTEKKEPTEDIDDVVNQLEKQEEEAEKNITFPYAIPGTELVIQKIEPFDGIFLEDGTDEAVSNVTTMLLENKGYMDIEYAEISIKCDDKKLEFEVSVLPGGSSMIIQEKNKAQYKKGTYQECRADAAEAGRLEMSEKQVKVTEKGNDSLEVTNLTDEMIPMVRIFYKYYMEKENVYVGGITYTAKIDELEKGSTQVVTPKHYIDGDSRIVMVRTYEN